MEILTRVLNRLRDEYTRSGKRQIFECLKDCLLRTPEKLSHAGAAKPLGITERGRCAREEHRLRKRFGKLLRIEIANLVRPARKSGRRDPLSDGTLIQSLRAILVVRVICVSPGELR